MVYDREKVSYVIGTRPGDQTFWFGIGSFQKIIYLGWELGQDMEIQVRISEK